MLGMMLAHVRVVLAHVGVTLAHVGMMLARVGGDSCCIPAVSALPACTPCLHPLPAFPPAFPACIPWPPCLHSPACIPLPAFPACIPWPPCLHSPACIPCLPSLPALPACTPVPSLPALPACISGLHSCLPCLHPLPALPACTPCPHSLPSLHALPACIPCLHSLHSLPAPSACPPCLPSLPSLPALPACGRFPWQWPWEVRPGGPRRRRIPGTSSPAPQLAIWGWLVAIPRDPRVPVATQSPCGVAAGRCWALGLAVMGPAWGSSGGRDGDGDFGAGMRVPRGLRGSPGFYEGPSECMRVPWCP
ncbi:protein diaphanous homolog 1-like [Rissa tridactyla]|uniref:protein diaphanous homolog 1-like n=1 Tax=Rissa tridactyla TaxID=75485 RepID=UPI0023BAAC13|nr:protein diaphanous homolog 1-like [Rissa tridactyla]XP_054079040.1 protein diaphanous homolog 1-like [Rissa tridactyla]XP_054079046.1 protein diaphanous homolog 1-like [Rissa tridactyla]